MGQSTAADSIRNFLNPDPMQQQQRRFQQIRNANGNIQDILQRRMVYMGGQQIANSHAPSAKLQIQNLPMSMSKNGIRLQDDCKQIMFRCQFDLKAKYTEDNTNKYQYKAELRILKARDEQKQLQDLGLEKDKGIFRNQCHQIINEKMLENLFKIGNQKESETTEKMKDLDELQELHVAEQFIKPDSSKIIKFTFPDFGVVLDQILIVISLQIRRKNKLHKNLVTIASISRLTNLAGANYFKMTQVRQKYFHQDTEFEVNEVFKVDGLDQADGEECKAQTTKDECSDCIVCFTNPKDVILLPCRHYCICQQCSDSIKFHTNQCPICREQVTRYVEIQDKSSGFKE